MTKKIITKKKPEKKLTVYIKKTAGRSTQTGQITARHRGGGVKRLYRIIDFGQEKMGVEGKVVAIERDPNRPAYIMLVEYEDGEKRYLLAPHGIKVGEKIICKEKTEIKIGNRMKLKNIPIGTEVYNIELIPNKGGKIVRGAGTSAKIVGQEEKYTILELPSKEIRKVPNECFATIGQVSHPEHIFEDVGKAGRNRLKGWRPRVRGKAMNPVDHPHGGGKGKAPLGMPCPKSIWGKRTKGIKTRKKKWTDKLIIKRRK
jgi:large subunit ribosomal protein L2